jgi:beta propeller repeat protein
MEQEGKSRSGRIALLILAFSLVLISAASAAPPGTETRISFSANPSCENVHPSADNGWIVWQERCPGYNDIIAYNYNSGVQLTLPNATLSSHSPDIRGNRVIWAENNGIGSSSLYYADLTTASPAAHLLNLPTSVKDNPVVDGNLIVWQDKPAASPTSDILMYNISSSTLFDLTPDTDASDQTNPSISGNHILWQDSRNGQRDVFMNTTYAGWATVNVTPGIPGAGQNRPVINGNRIIWYDDSYTIYTNDLTTTIPLPTYFAGDPVTSVAVCATYYSWVEDTSGTGSGPFEVFVNTTTSSSSPDQITSSASLPSGEGVVGDPDNAPILITPDSRVIWVDNRDGNNNIYMFTYGSTAPCPPIIISISPTGGPSPLLVSMKDLSSGTLTHWWWDFGDGSSGTTKNINHLYSSNGIYSARLLAGTPYCRNASDSQAVSVGIPSVDFTGTPTEGMVPLSVSFMGTATNSPTGWSWEFGDGGTAAIRNPSYIYTSAGTYTVNLTATNSFGNGKRSRPAYVTAINGLEEYSFTNVTGISVSGNGPSQSLAFDKAAIPTYILSADKKTLTAFPDAEYGWQKIVFSSGDASGFSEGPSTITGRITPGPLIIRELQPTSFSSGIGSNLRMSYNAVMGQYNEPAYFLTRVFEGFLPSDTNPFIAIIHGSKFSTMDVGYTMKVTRNNLSDPSSLILNLSAGSAWVKGISDIGTGRSETYIIGTGYDANGNLAGMVIPTRFIRNDTVNHLEYFEADIPSNTLYFSTFALAKLSGSGNPLQLITLTIQSHISPPSPQVNPPSESDSDISPVVTGAVKTPAPTPSPNVTATQTPVPADPGTSAKIYTNADGVVSQATLLRSTDGLATISISEGLVAKDTTGKPLNEITIKTLPPGSLPPVPPGSVFTFAGMAYEIGPDGATFSQPIQLSLAVPQAQWGQDYSVKSFDTKSSTWQDLPTSYDPSTGIVTVQVSHFCSFALFGQTRPSSSPVITAVTTPLPVPVAAPLKVPPPATAVNIFMSAITWVAGIVTNNVIPFIAVIIIGISSYLVMLGRSPGSGM